MPTVSLPLEDTNRTILSNIYFKIIQDIVDRIKIPYGTLVVLHKDTEVTLTDNKTNVSIQEKTNIPSTVSNKRVQVSVTEEYNEDDLTTTAVHQQSAYPIFYDPDISVSIFPIYVKSDINIEFTYITPSKIEANKIRDDIRIRLSQSRNIDIHEVEYDILIPQIVEDFITDIYDLKNRLVNQPLDVYFKQHSSSRIYPITDMSNESNTKLAIKEKQIRILGLFDFNSIPEKIEINNENNNYKFSFNYKLSLEIPRAICFKYPIMICNRLLPSKYISFLKDNKLDSKEEIRKNESYTSKHLSNLSIFESHRQLENRTDINLPVNVPIFDEFKERKGHPGYAIVASFLTDVNEENKKDLFNLKNIDPYEIPDFLLNYIIEEEYQYITKPYNSFLYLGLHQEGKYFDGDFLTIDNNLNISCIKELSLFKPVRVTLDYCIDISMLTDTTIKRLLNKPDILIFFLKEYIVNLNNYKTEAFTNYIDNVFYKIYLELLYYLYNRNDLISVTALLSLLHLDKNINKLITKTMYTEYNTLYNDLLKNKLIKIDSSLRNLIVNDNFNIRDNNIIATVMTCSVVAYKK